MVLDAELQHFEAIKNELLQHSEGRFALIIGSELLGVFDTQAEAYRVGMEKRGNVPMLIKQILKEEPKVRIPAMSLGLLCANL